MLIFSSKIIQGQEILSPPGFSQKSEIKTEEINTKDGSFSFITVHTLDYLSSSDVGEYVVAISKIISEKKQKAFILNPSGYTAKFKIIGFNLFSSPKEEKFFQDYLHDLCFDRRQLLVSEAEYERYSNLTVECNIAKTKSFLLGNRTQFSVYRYFGKLPDWVDSFDFFWGGILYLLLFISSLPHLFLFLFLFSFFRNYFRQNENHRKLVTVLVPFVYGFIWVFSVISLGENYRWSFWGMGVWKLLFYLSGLFFGLGFLGVKLLVNRFFYPEEGSLPDWAIGLILLFSPILLFAAGGAGGGKSSSTSTTNNSKSSDNQSKTTGGGKSGGGGAGGSF